MSLLNQKDKKKQKLEKPKTEVIKLTFDDLSVGLWKKFQTVLPKTKFKKPITDSTTLTHDEMNELLKELQELPMKDVGVIVTTLINSCTQQLQNAAQKKQQG